MAAILAISSSVARLDRTNEMVFERVDASLVALGKRLEAAQDAVQTAKITTEEVQQGLRDFAGREVSERVGSQLQFVERTEKLLVVWMAIGQVCLCRYGAGRLWHQAAKR
jgi:hypothetical protein